MGILMGGNSTTGHTSYVSAASPSFAHLLHFKTLTSVAFALFVSCSHPNRRLDSDGKSSSRFSPTLGPTLRGVEHSPLPATRENDAGLAPADKLSPTVEVKLEAELDDWNWVRKAMLETVSLPCNNSWCSSDCQAGRVTAVYPDSLKCTISSGSVPQLVGTWSIPTSRAVFPVRFHGGSGTVTRSLAWVHSRLSCRSG